MSLCVHCKNECKDPHTCRLCGSKYHSVCKMALTGTESVVWEAHLCGSRECLERVEGGPRDLGVNRETLLADTRLLIGNGKGAESAAANSGDAPGAEAIQADEGADKREGRSSKEEEAEKGEGEAKEVEATEEEKAGGGEGEADAVVAEEGEGEGARGEGDGEAAAAQEEGGQRGAIAAAKKSTSPRESQAGKSQETLTELTPRKLLFNGAVNLTPSNITRSPAAAGVRADPTLAECG